ncbi:O-methyltransferase [Streptomyces sp. CBMA156]|uniref:O-methyltransferase n=1 Tax=Streptomyces sp. CBMA156 TaxID=1930280 RepID=UPI001661C1E6|nr:class I SAM-dependent methyltransferase [Streptomyces sp. CBMA156]MBD0677033.1 methyltransferase [Streptomyces sp. CBMA156]
MDLKFHRHPVIDPGIEEYSAAFSTDTSEELKNLAARTAMTCPEWAEMASSPEQVSVLGSLVAFGRCRRVLEIGTFTGYSALAMAAALPPDGELITCDNYAVDSRARAVAMEAFAASPHGSKVIPRTEDAADCLRAVDGPFDLIFIDADKPSYVGYFETVMDRELLAPHGLMLVDNTLWGGTVLHLDELPRTPPDDAKDGQEWLELLIARWAEHVHAFNLKVATDPRVVATILTIRDGLTMIRRQR